VLDRYQTAARYADVPPRGLDEAWGLAAATLATVVGKLADIWADHPDFSEHWTR
jgi:hypothetical protein